MPGPANETRTRQQPAQTRRFLDSIHDHPLYELSLVMKLRAVALDPAIVAALHALRQAQLS